MFSYANAFCSLNFNGKLEIICFKADEFKGALLVSAVIRYWAKLLALFREVDYLIG